MLMPKSFDLQSIKKPHLVTIPYSHYCELSRWALEYAGIEFQEMKYIPGYHAKVVGQLRRDKADRSDSSYVGQESGVHGGRRKYAVPLLCLPDGRIVRDSWEILDYAVGPVDIDTKTTFDQELGIAVRRLAYHFLLAADSRHLLNRMMKSTSVYERILWFFIGNKVVDGIKQLLAITPENAERSRDTILSIFESVGRTLNDRGSLDPSGTFGPADIAFCSLAAYCVMPDNFSNGAVRMPSSDEVSPDFQTFIEACRATTAGQYIQSSYQTHRSQSRI